jgi:CRISP-associated protein Cas1
VKPQRTIDLRSLPKLRDGLSYLFVERGRIERDDASIAWYGPDGAVAIPVAGLAALFLGPGMTITHAAMIVLADNGVTVAWVGEEGVRFYAVGTGETRSARNVERQVRAWADPQARAVVARRLYEFRFREPVDPALTLEQVRGMEGVRVRTAYGQAAKQHGIAWKGRRYRRDAWDDADPVNRALSAANACLYGTCHAAITSLGFSTALGFLHSGKMLSFVYDIADLYKADLVIPAAFAAAAASSEDVERRVRHQLRDAFRSERLLERVARDLHRLFDLAEVEDAYVADAALPGDIWDADGVYVPGGTAYGHDDA